MARLNCVHYPQKPILIDVAMSTTKGCSFQSKLLNKKSVLNNKIHERETKWHAELGSTFSINFWNRARNLCSRIDFDNQLKWLQHQIVRNSLQTNYIVSHFKPNVSKICSYCQDPDSLELVSHLFWLCPIIGEFIRAVFQFFSTLGLDYFPTKSEFLFGCHNTHPYTPKNFICLVLKKYIWRMKFKNTNLTLVSFNSLLKIYLHDLKFMLQYKDKLDAFNEWNTIFNAL